MNPYFILGIMLIVFGSWCQLWWIYIIIEVYFTKTIDYHGDQAKIWLEFVKAWKKIREIDKELPSK